MTDEDQRDVVRQGYDAIAADYDAARSADPFPGALFDRFLAGLPDAPRVLDAGCGAAQGVLQHLPAGATGVGLDISTEQLRLARERTGTPLVTGDMAHLPFVADRFDGLTAFHATIHVPIDDHPALYREFARVLRPGGRLLCTVSEEGWVGENDDWLGTGERMAWAFPSVDATRELLRDAGFEEVERAAVRSEMDDGSWPFLLCRLAAGEGGEGSEE